MDCQKHLQDVQKSFPCQMSFEESDMINQRRSANYKPNIWKYDFLQSLTSKYDGEEYTKKAEKLIEDVKGMFAEEVELLAKLELIDILKKVGLASHFDEEIKEALDTIASMKKNIPSAEDDLYTTALCFRILRQHGYEVSQDTFRGFMNENGTFKKTTWADIKGMLELLEASHLGLEGENILDLAREFSTQTLKDASPNLESKLAKKVAHALELPSQRRVQWFDVKWHINKYEKDQNMKSFLLNLAKLNFNIIQATLQKDLRESSRWWKNLGLTENLEFARDRLVESFMCSVGLTFEPQHKYFRKWLTKVAIWILILDDVYDVYGSLEELKHFTNAVNRWDVKETQQLPECMKICFQALYNTTNEIANEIQKENGWDKVLPYLKKAWTDLCNSFFVEAKWYNVGYTPSLQEYLSNAWISSSCPVILVHAFFSVAHEVPGEMENFLEKNKDLEYNISLIFRLCNDLATSTAELERGDVSSSVLCYMREVNVSEDIAQKHIKEMLNKAWKKINEQYCFTQLPMLKSFLNIAINVARLAHIIYQRGDGIGVQDRDTQNNILSFLVEPFIIEL